MRAMVDITADILNLTPAPTLTYIYLCCTHSKAAAQPHVNPKPMKAASAEDLLLQKYKPHNAQNGTFS